MTENSDRNVFLTISNGNGCRSGNLDRSREVLDRITPGRKFADVFHWTNDDELMPSLRLSTCPQVHTQE
jgi:hypothetical protein